MGVSYMYPNETDRDFTDLKLQRLVSVSLGHTMPYLNIEYRRMMGMVYTSTPDNKQTQSIFYLYTRTGISTGSTSPSGR